MITVLQAKLTNFSVYQKQLDEKKTSNVVQADSYTNVVLSRQEMPYTLLNVSMIILSFVLELRMGRAWKFDVNNRPGRKFLVCIHIP
jgi:hypothetical protein